MYIQAGKPGQKAYIEQYIRTVGHEWLSLHAFESVDQPQHLAKEWLWLYDNGGSNTAIGGVLARQLLQVA